jgi:predicted alpha/beta-fold hydrolase
VRDTSSELRRSADDGLVDPFHPPRYLASAHVQSVLASSPMRKGFLKRRLRPLMERSQDVILDCGDGVRLHGYHAAGGPGQARGLVVLIHGWEGSAEAMYVMSTAQRLMEQGFDVFRLNLRDHGPSHHLNPELFHSNRIGEVVGAVGALAERYRPEALMLAGFSLGGNFCLRVAARAPAAGLDIRQVVAICPVLEPAHTLDALESGWALYRQYFVRKWRRSLRKKQLCFPDLYDFTEILQLGTLTEMTDYLVQHHTGFADLEEYLNGYALTRGALESLSVPSRIITTADDPMIPSSDLERVGRTHALTVTVTERGGHCGYVDTLGTTSWAERQICRLIERAARG